MKPQDIVFIIILIIILLFKRKYIWNFAMALFVMAGLLFLVNNLFTSQRLSWYAAGAMLIAIIMEARILVTKKSK